MKFCRVHIICLLLLVGNIAELRAQTSTSNVDSLLVLARTHAKQQRLVQSLRHYFQVLRVTKQQQNPSFNTAVHIEIGDVYQAGNLHQKSLEYYLRADSISVSEGNLADRSAVISRIGLAYQRLNNYSTALKYYAKEVRIYKQQRQKVAMVKPYRHMVECYQKLKQYKQALAYNLKILATIKGLNNRVAEITTLNNIGFAYKYLKNYPNALRYFKESLKKQQALSKYPLRQVPTQVNIAIIYQNQGRYEEALELLLQTVRVAEKSNKNAEKAQLYDLLALVYYYQKDYYNALQYNQQSIALAKAIHDRNILVEAYKTSSLIYQKQDDYEKALTSFQQHLLIKDSLVQEERSRQQALAQQKFVVERAEKQIKLIMAGEEIKDLALKQQQLELEKQQKEFELLEKEKKIQDAQLRQEALAKQQALQSLQLARQRATAAQKDKEIVQLQAEKKQKEQVLQLKALEEQKKRKQIQLLEKDQKIKALDLERKNQEIKEQRKVQKYFVGVIALGVLVFILILIGLFITRRSNQKLAKKKDEIEEKNTELFQVNEEIATQRDLLETKNVEIENINHNLTASIVYAQRIQEAMLPSLSRIQAYLPESFVLFRPRDIVSGDFYWFAKIKSIEQNEQQEHAHATKLGQSMQLEMMSSKLVLAVVDCTGHGVPGALMSMTGNNLLNEIVEMRGTDRPDQILRQLHRGVKKALKQDETNNRDGMDMALCVIDVQQQVVSFAGAKNPLVVIQNGKLQEIKGDKTPIGGEWGKEEDRKFTNHTIRLDNEEAMFYMFSDGYQDQFGGPEGKKFMKGRFKKLLLEIHHLPLDVQKQKLDDTITQWITSARRESTERSGKIESQIDDILVVGFRMPKKEERA